MSDLEVQVRGVVKSFTSKGCDVAETGESLLNIGPEAVRVLISLFRSEAPDDKDLSQNSIAQCLVLFAAAGNGQAEKFIEDLHFRRIRCDDQRGGHLAETTAFEYFNYQREDPFSSALQGLLFLMFQVIGVALLIKLTLHCYGNIGESWRTKQMLAFLGWTLVTVLCVTGSVGLLGYTVSYPFRVMLPRVFGTARYGFTNGEKHTLTVLCAGLGGILFAAAGVVNNVFPLGVFLIGLVFGGVVGLFAASRLKDIVLCPKCSSKRTRFLASKAGAQDNERSCEQCGHTWR